MKASIATVTIKGISPLSQSRQHDAPFLEGEGKDAYDARTWQQKLNVSPMTGKVVLPAHGMHQAICAAAKYTGKQIPGQGKKTWTAKFMTGIAILSEIDTGLDPNATQVIVISANSDGVRGSGKRVTRRFPIFYEWGATFEVHILDPIITEPVFREMLEIAGMFIGLGRFRPEKGGQNGRFRIESLDWQDNRKMAA
jgi:hypothetical protein